MDIQKPPSHDKVMGIDPATSAVLCYFFGVWWSGPLLMTEKKNQKARFHAWQSILMMVGFFVAVIGLVFLGILSLYVSPLLGIFVQILLAIFILAYLFVLVIAIIRAYQGKCWKIPFLGTFAEKLACKVSP